MDKETEKLSPEKQKAYETVFNDLIECDLFKGIYDAKHGSENYMHGISCIMEVIASNVSDECYEKFTNDFMDNMIKSETKAERRC